MGPQFSSTLPVLPETALPQRPLLTQPVISDASGNFSLTSLYSCPTGASLVYVVATGGNPGLAPGTNNAALNMMTAITVTNTGDAPLTITNTAITTANPGEFVASGTCGVVPAGQTCTVSVSFAPQVAGTRTGTLQIVSDAPTSPDVIQLSGVAQ